MAVIKQLSVLWPLGGGNVHVTVSTECPIKNTRMPPEAIRSSVEVICLYSSLYSSLNYLILLTKGWEDEFWAKYPFKIPKSTFSRSPCYSTNLLWNGKEGKSENSPISFVITPTYCFASLIDVNTGLKDLFHVSSPHAVVVAFFCQDSAVVMKTKRRRRTRVARARLQMNSNVFVGVTSVWDCLLKMICSPRKLG